MTPILSICIPNYNRPEMLAKNLAALARQYLPGQVEIVVVDDCSPQSVISVIKDFQKKYPQIKLKFLVNKPNLGFDKNVLKVISVARGKYCWLLSNDDQVLPGSLKKIISLIKKYPQVSLISVNYQRYDYLAKSITAHKMVTGIKSQLFNDANKFFFYPAPRDYFKFLGVNTLTMSTDVVRRQWWNKSASQVKPFIKHNFIHEFVIANLIKTHPQIYFVSQPQVEYLANNNRTWANKVWTDYNLYFLDYLIKLGFNRPQVLNLRQKLKTYEFRESLTKNPFTATIIRTILKIRGICQRNI